MPEKQTIIFDVPGIAVGKGSPKFRVVRPGKKNQFVQVYYDGKTKAWMELVGVCAKRAAPREPWTGAIELTITVNVKVPDSWNPGKRALALKGGIRPTTKPDWDNYGKGICDPMKGVIWKDDSQVVDGRVVLWYAAIPMTTIQVRSIDPVTTQVSLGVE